MLGTFYDGTTLENIDVIVSCTGYRTGVFPFLPETIMAECREEYVVGGVSERNVFLVFLVSLFLFLFH